MSAFIQSLSNRDGDDVYPVTTAAAVYVQKTDSSGTYSQQSLDKKLEEMETSFQDGVDTIVSALTELGVTPSATSPAGIAEAIKKLYTERYEKGVAAVIADPGSYGLITEDDYKKYGEEQYQAGVEYADSIVNTSSASYTSGYNAGKVAGVAALNKTVTTTASYSKDTNNGCRLKINSAATATATIQNSRLYVKLSLSGDGWAAYWHDDDWTLGAVSASGNDSGNNNTSVA